MILNVKKQLRTIYAREIHCNAHYLYEKVYSVSAEFRQGDVSIVSILKACVKQKNLERGSRIHADLLKRGLLEADIYVNSMLISLYATCGELTKAQEVFNQLSVRDTVTWTALIAGYAQHGYGEKALLCFQQMQWDGFSPDAITFVCILKACGSIGAVEKADEIHAAILKEDFLQNNVLVGTALVDMYAKCSKISKMLLVFDELPFRNVVSWNAVISGFVSHGYDEEALDCIEKMKHEGLLPDSVTFLGILKACGNIGACRKGKEVHAPIVSTGLLQINILVGTAMLGMYTKCDALTDAQDLFDELPVQNVVAWSVMIAGYAQYGHGLEAVNNFEAMRYQGLLPNTSIYISILKTCGHTGVFDKGKEMHIAITKGEFLDGSISMSTALLDMYLKCGAFDEACNVFSRLKFRDIISWNTLISGYIQNGHSYDALNSFKQMQCDGVSPDAFTFVCILKAYSSLGFDENSKENVGQDFLETKTCNGNTQTETCVLAKALEVFDRLPIRDVICWNAIIAVHAQHEHREDALNWLQRMQDEGVSPNAETFIWVLKSCGSIGAIDKGREIHADIISKGLTENDDLISTALMDMYVKCVALAEAESVFHQLLFQDAVSWTALMEGYAQNGQARRALFCFMQMQQEGLLPDAFTYRCVAKACGSIGATVKGQELHARIARQDLEDIFVSAAIVDMYAKCGSLSKARDVFEEFPTSDLVSWNALVTGYVECGDSENAVNVFERMRHEGLYPDAVTFVYILKACGSIGSIIHGKKIHAGIIGEDLLETDCLVGNALIDMYAKCGDLDKAKMLFHELPIRDVVGWTSLITGYAQHGHGEEALNYFEGMQLEGFSPNEITFVSVLKSCGSTKALHKGNEIHVSVLREGFLESNILVSTALVDMYAKCGVLKGAREVFDKLHARNVVAWNAIIAGYAQHGDAEGALDCFKLMRHEGFCPNVVTYICTLKACGIWGSIVKGKEIHTDILVMRLVEKDISIGNALVDMYVKCGAPEKAKLVFDDLKVRTVASWTALISGYAKLGEHNAIIQLFKRMIDEGIEPNRITFTVVLNACSHLGLIDEGQMCYESMCTIYGIVPTSEHQTCMVDLLARAGHFEEAFAMIKKIPMTDYLPIWTALLGACQKWGNVNLGRLAFEHALELDEKDAGLYVCIRNIRASAMQAEGRDDKEMEMFV